MASEDTQQVEQPWSRLIHTTPHRVLPDPCHPSAQHVPAEGPLCAGSWLGTGNTGRQRQT